MNIIVDMWRFAELCSHDDQGDFIKDHLTAMDKNVLFTIMKNNEDYGYIAEFEDRIIFCFRGTDGLKAWLTDFKPYPLDTENQCTRGYIHDGFYDAWSFFKPVVDDYLKNNLQENKRIYVTGHSRGGALTGLCYRHLVKNRGLFDKTYGVSFGAPAQGIEQYQKEMKIYEPHLIRVVNHRDIVPTLPPYSLGFRHIGIDFKMNYNIDYTFEHGIVDEVYDHAYSRYTDSLMKYCEARDNKEELILMQEVRKRVNI